MAENQAELADTPLSVWTSREAHFRCFPSTPDDKFEAFFDALPEHYWDTWRHRAFGTLAIGSCERVVHIGGWPWWVPKWYARRSIAALAAAAGVGGDAYFVTERAVLV